MKPLTPQQRAGRCAEVMMANDGASQALGIIFNSVEPGKALCSLVVEQRHLNGHGMCHGGVIYTLADTAFALACNSYNESAASQHNSIDYLSPGHCGDRLHANAVEISRLARSGVYDVEVTDQNNRLIAVFRGCSRAIKGTLFDE